MNMVMLFEQGCMIISFVLYLFNCTLFSILLTVFASSYWLFGSSSETYLWAKGHHQYATPFACIIWDWQRNCEFTLHASKNLIDDASYPGGLTYDQNNGVGFTTADRDVENQYQCALEPLIFNYGWMYMMVLVEPICLGHRLHQAQTFCLIHLIWLSL